MNSPLDKDDASRSREEQVGAVVAGVLYDRMSGEGRSDEEIVAEFPQLMPELGDALRKLQLVADAAEQCEEEQWLQAMERMEAERRRATRPTARRAIRKIRPTLLHLPRRHRRPR